MPSPRSLPAVAASFGVLLISCSSLVAQTVPASSKPPANSAPSPGAVSTVPAKPATVEVVSRGNQLQVKVPDQAPLSTVLSSVCQHQKVKCTGTETLTSYRGPAMTVDGTLREVISKLLEGTDVNYEFSRSSQGSATEISFLGHAPRGTAAVPTPPAQEKPDHPTILRSRPYPGSPGSPTASPQSTPPQSTPPQSQLRPTTPGGSETRTEGTQAAASSDNARAASMLFTGTGDNTPAQFQPFPDQNGQPIPINNTPATAQPFPDQHGNPIPVKPATGGSPFPVKPTAPTSGDQVKH